jgi:hypothetical protein
LLQVIRQVVGFELVKRGATPDHAKFPAKHQVYILDCQNARVEVLAYPNLRNLPRPPPMPADQEPSRMRAYQT